MQSNLTLDQASTIGYLRTCSTLGGFDEQLLRLFASNPSTREVHVYQPGDWVLEQEARMPDGVGVHILVGGLAHVLRAIEPVRNRRKTAAAQRAEFRHVAFRYPPQPIGALLSLAQVPAEVGVRCITECRVLSLHCSDVQTALLISPRFGLNLYREWARRFRQYAERAEWGRHLSSQEVVATFFYEAGIALQHCNNVPAHLPMKQQEIADLIGVPFDLLRLKILPEFRKNDLIRFSEKPEKRERGKIYIPDPSHMLRMFPKVCLAISPDWKDANDRPLS